MPTTSSNGGCCLSERRHVLAGCSPSRDTTSSTCGGVGVAPERIAVVRCAATSPGGPRAAICRQAAVSHRHPWAPRREERYRRRPACPRAAGADAPGPVELSVAGDGPQRVALARQAIELGVADRVDFLAPSSTVRWGRGCSPSMPSCWPASPTRVGTWTAFPVVLMEAMAQHVPVVSTRLSGIPELVIHESTGLLATPGDPVARLGPDAASSTIRRCVRG